MYIVRAVTHFAYNQGQNTANSNLCKMKTRELIPLISYNVIVYILYTVLIVIIKFNKQCMYLLPMPTYTYVNSPCVTNLAYIQAWQTTANSNLCKIKTRELIPLISHNLIVYILYTVLILIIKFNKQCMYLLPMPTYTYVHSPCGHTFCL